MVIQDAAVSGRHVYFHLDRRGVFAVDLATRTGARIGPEGMPWAWLDRGDSLEVAGHRVELVDWHLDDAEPAPESEPVCPLDDAGSSDLARLTLYPEAPGRNPLTLNSRLVFAGRSTSCGVLLDELPAMRVHCVLIRGRSRVRGGPGGPGDLAQRGAGGKGRGPLVRRFPHDRHRAVPVPRRAARLAPNLPALALGVGSTDPVPFAQTTLLEEFAAPPCT